MQRFEHGGDIYRHPGVIDFSASLNPLGIPQRAVEVLRTSIDSYAAYPDPRSQELTAALARHEGVPAQWVLVCAGATDALTRIVQVLRPTKALLCAPCYVGYAQALDQVGAEVAYHALREEDDFTIGADSVDALDASMDVVFVASPNNPTGRCLDRAVLVALLDRARELGLTVVLDECFIDLSEGTSGAGLLESYRNLVVVKAFTKSYALAGLRLGYALSSDEALVAALYAAGQPWAVSVPAQLAGVACLQQEGYLVQSRALVARERAGLEEALRAQGLRVIRSDTNYLLFFGPVGLYEAMLDRGILLRACDNFVGLGPGWYRAAVRAPKENAHFVAALKEAMR